MKFSQFNEKDFQEYLLDVKNATLKKEEDNKKSNLSDLEKDNLGFLDIGISMKGKVYMCNRKGNLKENIILKNENFMDSIFLFLSKKDSFSLNKKTGKVRHYIANTNGVYFFNQNTNSENDIILKNKDIEDISLNIPIPYFENLVNLYPELFEASFQRYQKGESFFLTENFNATTALHYTILSQIENSHLIGTCSNAYIDAKILELLSINFSRIDKKQISNNSKFIYCDKINEATFILKTTLTNPPSVRELALKVGLNPNLLREGFKEMFNTTVYGYLFDYKMQLAEQYLRDTKKTIAEIALLCGYEHTSHFCTAFKRRFGISPLKMREKS